MFPFPLRDNVPLSRFPLVTVLLVAINAIAYVLEIRHGGSLLGGPTESVSVHYGAIPYELTHPGSHCELALEAAPGAGTSAGTSTGSVLCSGQAGVSGAPSGQPPTWETAVTSMFLHGSVLHIFGNMVFLAIFGPTLEDRVGRARFIAFYLIGGLVALGAQVLIDPNSTDPTLGASGAIAAVLGGYILLYPRARILTLIFIVFFVTIVELPALLLLGLWFLEQLYFVLAGAANPLGGQGVAYFAHIGGFVFGLLAVRVFIARRPSAGGPPASVG